MRVDFYDSAVAVKVTEAGRKIIREYYNSLRNHPTKLITLAPLSELKEDAEGYSEWHLKDLMKVFGPYMDRPIRFFERTIKITGEQDAVNSTGSSGDCRGSS